MKSIDETGVTFVNAVLGRGVFNGVVNIQFGTILFSISDDGSAVENDIAVTCRLRMDMMCAKQLRDSLTDLLASIEHAQTAQPAPGVAPNGHAVSDETTLN